MADGELKRVVKRNPELVGMAEVVSDIVYAVHDGEDLRMDVIMPWSVDFAKEHGRPLPHYPAILFIQG